MKLSYAQTQEIVGKTDFSNYPKLRLVILRNIMLEPIEPYYKYLAYQIGFDAQVKFGEYDNIYQEATGSQTSLVEQELTCILIFMKLETLSLDLSRNFAKLSTNDIHAEIERIKQYIDAVLIGIRTRTNAMLLWHGFELPVYPAFGVSDSQLKEGQLATFNELNRYLQENLRKHQNAYFVDTNSLLSRHGFINYYDRRYWHIGRAPYSREALSEIAGEDFKFIRSLKGKNKKCLALDCDNTLWGGIIGEDGLAGIKLGKTFPGSPYSELQEEIVNLYHRGVIITLCSKNNEQDVWEVFRKHPDMVLKEEHIAAARINWEDKVNNLRRIASDLNIGLDSMVFVDDNDFEINLVREMMPEVAVIHLPAGKAFEYRDILASCGLFDTLTVSEEDKKRGSLYKAETSRKIMLEQAPDLHSYLRSLEMITEIRRADDFSIPRIAQLTQKTNQFNLTTRRYSDADIKAIEKSRDADVIYLSLKDRFGDSGIVGACILKYNNDEALIDTLLLSCRVLGRGVEDVFLIQVLKCARNKGCRVAIGEYLPTKKNTQVESFYTQRGFTEVPPSCANPSRQFRYEFSQGIQPEADFFYNIISDIE
jgi:FkbH-like protein